MAKYEHEGITSSRAIANKVLAEFMIVANSDIKTVYIKTDVPPSVDSPVEVLLNGTTIYVMPTDRPEVDNSTGLVNQTGLTVAVVKGDIVTVGMPATVASNKEFGPKNYVIVTSDDGVSPGTGTVDSVVAGSGITVDNTDPANPIVAATGGGGGSVGTFWADAPFASPSAEDDEFDAGTLDAKWSFMGAGQGPLGVTSGYGGSFLRMTPDVGDYPALRGIKQPTTDVDQAWAIKLYPGRGLGSSMWQGLMIGDTGTANAWWGYVYDPNDRKIKSIGYTANTGPNSGPTDVGTLFTNEHEIRAIYIKCRYVSSTKTVYGYVSTDGINYALVGSQGTNGGGGADKVGIVCYGGETTNVHLIDWFRKLQSNPFTGRVI